MSQAILIAEIEYFRSSEMQSRYFDDDVPGQGVNVDEFLSPGGRRKEIRVNCLSDLAKEKALFARRRKLDLDLATSIKFVNFQASCEPDKILSKVWKFFKNAKSVKIGKLRPNQKRGEEKQLRYNGWVNFFGSGDCNRAKRLIERKKQKFGNMKIEKVGNVKCIGFDYKKKFIVSQLIRFKAKKEVLRQFYSWGNHWSPKIDSRFAEDFFDGLLSNGVVLVE